MYIRLIEYIAGATTARNLKLFQPTYFWFEPVVTLITSGFSSSKKAAPKNAGTAKGIEHML